ncbi:MAG TPA: hypothetical protein VK983_00350, partial [Candidatus Limnocylindrales bacterium]|nr:hypothetical protein [Candidatus Limnocylindrales bacterium]
ETVSKFAAFTIDKVVFNKENNTVGFQVDMKLNKRSFAQAVPKDKAGNLVVNPDEYEIADFFTNMYHTGKTNKQVRTWCLQDVQAITEAGKKLGPMLPDLAEETDKALNPDILASADNVYAFPPDGKAQNTTAPNAYLFINDPSKRIICGDAPKPEQAKK